MTRPELKFHSGRVPSRSLQVVGVWRTADGRTHGRSLASGGTRRIEWDRLGTFELEDQPPVVHAWPWPEVCPDEVVEGFARHVRPIVFQAWGWEALHASSVLGPLGALAFCGLSGSGKSTLACACARRGWIQLGDDAVVWESGPSAPAMLVVPFARRLREPSREYFASARRPRGRPRTHAGAPETVPLASICILQQDAASTSDVKVNRVGARGAFTRLLPHAHAFDVIDPGERRRLAEAYLGMAERVPVFDVIYRPDFSRIDVLVDAVLALPSLAPPGVAS
jgi:hypothetical protein